MGNYIYPSLTVQTIHDVVIIVLVVLMLLCAIAAIILVLFQPGNSQGIDALGGSSETFFGKNKGRSMESKMKKWTIIVLVILAVLAIAFFILQFPVVWGAETSACMYGTFSAADFVRSGRRFLYLHRRVLYSSGRL